MTARVKTLTAAVNGGRRSARLPAHREPRGQPLPRPRVSPGTAEPGRELHLDPAGAAAPELAALLAAVKENML